MAAYPSRARTFVKGEGAMLHDENGKTVFDCTSSIWTTVHGHCHPHITRRIAEQAAVLDHSTLLGAANPPALKLAGKLAALTGLDYAFFSGDGASAVEAALKIALQYWQNTGEPHRTRVVALKHAYHGDTAGAMSVSDIAVFKARFAPLTFETHTYDDAPGLLRAPDVAAVIVEPLVQAAAGIRIVPASAYAPLRDRTTLLIVDEIATGFGRTGTMFASEQLDLKADLMCLGKGLTGGTLALSATMATRAVYDAFTQAGAQPTHFFHGHSFAGNPIACAAALASLELFESEGTLTRIDTLARVLRRELEPLAELPQVAGVRGVGCMYAVEVRGAEGAGWTLADSLYERGYFTRPIGNAIQYVPPYCTTDAEVEQFARALREEIVAWAT